VTAIVVLISGFFVARGGRATGRAVWWFYVAGLIGVVLLTVNALTHSTTDFRVAYDHATMANAYNQVIASAHANGIATGSSWSGLLLVLPFIVLFYNGFSQNNLPAGELKRPAKTYLRATLLCLAAAGVLQIVCWLALKHLTGLTFIQSASALSQGNPTVWAHVTGGAGFTGPYYGELLGSPVVRILIAGGFLFGSLINPIAVTFVASRVMFALSFDRIIPSRLADVRDRSHMPVNAALLATAIVALFAALTIFSSSIATLLRNGLLMSLFVFIVSSFAAAILPFRRPDLFDSSPKVLSRRIGRVPLISLVAVVSIVVEGWLFYEAATNPSLSGGYSVSSVSTLAGIGVIGVLAYVISRLYLRRAKGVNIDLAMKELPPD
jgi:basic amino acid/polyamine antiporter, APA family